MPGFPTHVWRKTVCALPIPPAQKVVLIRMAEYADYQTGRNAWPSRDALAADCAVSPSVVDRARNAGRKHGVIVQASGGHKGANPVYHLLMSKDVTSDAKDVSSDNQRTSVVTPLPTPIPTPINNDPWTKPATGQAANVQAGASVSVEDHHRSGRLTPTQDHSTANTVGTSSAYGSSTADDLEPPTCSTCGTKTCYGYSFKNPALCHQAKGAYGWPRRSA